MTEITAAMLVIGDEILSGRTKDRNVGHLAEVMTAIGIDLREVRMIGDDVSTISRHVRDLSSAYTYLFTTGGIGPTHDDKTADGVSAAFDRPCIHDPRAHERLATFYRSRDLPFTKARQRMTRMPEGADLIDNPVSVAPGFRIRNVHVFAGIPKVFQAMLDEVVPTLQTGTPLLSRAVPCPHGEGDIGGPLATVQDNHPDVMLGSYPRYEDGRFSVEIVLRARDPAALDAAEDEVRQMLAELDNERDT